MDVEDLQLGASFAFTLGSAFDQSESVSTAIVYVAGAAKHIKVSGTLATEVFELVGTLVENKELLDEEFQLQFALQTKSGVTGEYMEKDIVIKEKQDTTEDGDEEDEEEAIEDGDQEETPLCTCTTVDACCDGCLSINEGGACSDEFACTTSSCLGGQCTVSGTEAGCFIAEACFDEGDTKAATGDDSCQVCTQASDWQGWTTQNSGSCDDGNACTLDDVCGADSTCIGTQNTCSDHGTCSAADGTCTCDNEHMNEDCSACEDGYTGFPECTLAFPEGYCDANQCWPVPPTNQTACYNASGSIAGPGTAGGATCGTTDYCGQDAQYPNDERIFTCYNSDGIETPCESLPTAGADEVVTDSLTGLMWQRYLPETYAGCAEGSTCTWQQALEYCNALTYGGHSDWRLPNAHELRSLVDYGRINPSINTTVFPGTPSSSFWSSSTYVGNTDYAWRVGFNYGGVDDNNKTYSSYARCVREGPVESGIGSFDPFVISFEEGEELVTDLITGLIWQKDYTTTSGWQQALAYCESLSYGGHSDWRLPNVHELASLVNYNLLSPASDFPDMPSNRFWSSSTLYNENAWYVLFSVGMVDNTVKFVQNYDARCVREGP